ncbi:MAG: hypothetical protein JW995_09070 [Melioribacteraceae bacterium]|nr:hypothetical protein [Melioribacteraceae bacterium]
MKKYSDYYDTSDYHSPVLKNGMWMKIRDSIAEPADRNLFKIDLRSYALGIMSAIIISFSIAGIRSIYMTFYNDSLPELVRMNKTYLTATEGLEKLVAERIRQSEIKTPDEGILNKNESLASINKAIQEIQISAFYKDYSSVKQQRLKTLYLMKPQILDEIISLEGEPK